MSEKTRVIGAAGGALGLSALAAALGLCCTVPWAVALLGVAGAVAFARLAFLLPYALFGAALLLGIGFWWAYRKPTPCADGTCAPARRKLRGSKEFTFLDSEAFAREVHQLLAQLPPADHSS